jgi:phosphoenolpyruvate---glycerone phosphotransferase subunit DhaL
MSDVITPQVIDNAALLAALARWCDALDAAAPELNALDARLGDGDLGTTLGKCAANVRGVLLDGQASAPQDIAGTFKACAQACMKASGSSFGTLLALAFLTAAKVSGQRETLDRAALVELLQAARDALSQRGGAALGDKTMLDSLHAVASALAASAPDADLRAIARRGAADALQAFRDRPNRIGRARMFADQSIGLDDPGMVAVQRMADAL